MAKVQIGFFNLLEDKVYTNTFECAAWYEDVLVKAGRYPIYVHDYRVRTHENEKYNNEVEGHANSVSIEMPGVVVRDDFGSRFCGMPIGTYDGSQNAGKASSHSRVIYLYEIAESVFTGNTEFELLDGYEAREINFEYNGEHLTTYGIYKA